MGGKFIIDTNAIIDFRAGYKGIVKIFSEAETLYLPVIVLGELLYGAKNSSNVKNNLDFIKKFLEHTIVVSIDSQIAEYYSEVRTLLKKQGKPIPENDLWIAGICKKLNLPLLTKDFHFKLIKGITVVNW